MNEHTYTWHSSDACPCEARLSGLNAELKSLHSRNILLEAQVDDLEKDMGEFMNEDDETKTKLSKENTRFHHDLLRAEAQILGLRMTVENLRKQLSSSVVERPASVGQAALSTDDGLQAQVVDKLYTPNAQDIPQSGTKSDYITNEDKDDSGSRIPHTESEDAVNHDLNPKIETIRGLAEATTANEPQAQPEGSHLDEARILPDATSPASTSSAKPGDPVPQLTERGLFVLLSPLVPDSGWSSDAIAYVNVDLGHAYLALLEKWLTLERFNGWKYSVQSHLPKKGRPNEIDAFLSLPLPSRMSYSPPQTAEFVVPFAEVVSCWWRTMQPKWRQPLVKGTLSVNTNGKDWKTLSRFGPKGWFTLLVCMKWWGQGLNTTADADWTSTLQDMSNTLDGLLDHLRISCIGFAM